MEDKHNTEAEVAEITSSRKPYAPPVLEMYGDVRDLTLGGTAMGTLDSINTKTKI